MTKSAKNLMPQPPVQKDFKAKKNHAAFRRYARLSREELAELIEVTLQMKELHPNSKALER